MLDRIERTLDWLLDRQSAYILWTVCVVELGFIIGSRIAGGKELWNVFGWGVHMDPSERSSR